MAWSKFVFGNSGSGLRWRIIAALALAFIAVGCGDDGSQSNVVPPPEPEMNPEPNPDPEPCGNGVCDAGEEESCPDDCPVGDCPDGQAVCLDEFGVEDNSLCGPGSSCTEGCCVPEFACTEDAECEARSGEDVNCQDTRLDCACNTDTGACFTRVCSADSDCSGQLCVDGACIDAPEDAGLEARIISAPTVLAEGERTPVLAVAVDPDSGAVVAGVEIAVTSSDEDAVGADGDELIGGTNGQTATITARVSANGADPGDSVQVRNVIAPPDQGVRVTVINESTGAPVVGATVVIHGEEPLTGTTDAGGHAVIADAEAPFSVTVMAEEHSFVTIADTESTDLLVPLPQRVVTDLGLDEVERELVYDDLRNVDIVQGKPDFARVLNTGEIEIALTGFGLGSGLLDLNFDLIVGPSVDQFLPPNTGLPLPTDSAISIPGGVTLLFNRQPVVERFLLVSPPGVRTMWTLGGRVSLIENPNLVSQILSSIEGEIEIGQIVAAILPFFANFYSGFTQDVALTDAPQLPPREIPIALTVPTALETTIATPALPSIGNTRIDGVLYLGGVIVPGTGFLPLGITAGLDATGDEEADGRIDGDPMTPEIDPVTLQLSPIHSGLQGPHTRYVVVVVGLSFDTVGGGDGREATTVLISTAEPGQAMPAVSELPRADFLDFSGESSFNPGERQLNLAAGDADLVRTVFEGEEGLKWIVWSAPDTDTLKLPNPAEHGFADPAERNRVRVELLDLNEDADDDLDSLAALRGRGLSEIINVISGFSLVELLQE